MIGRTGALLMLASAVAGAAAAFADPRTDSAYQTAAPEPTLATLYVRSDGALDPTTRAAIASAVRLLARVPGATLTIALEPRDQNAGSLADTLDALPDASARVALLARLADVSAARWAQRDVVARVSGIALQRTPSASFLVARPARLVAPAQSYFEIAGIVDPDEAKLDALAAADELAGPAAPPAHRRLSGMAGHRLELPWRAARDVCGPLELFRRVESSGRVRVSINAEVDPAAPIGVRVIGRALRRATPSAQLKLAELACHFPMETIQEAAWLLGAAGIDPEASGLLDSTSGSPPLLRLSPTPSPASHTSAIVDGLQTSFLDALSLQRLPSLRHRLIRR